MSYSRKNKPAKAVQTQVMQQTAARRECDHKTRAASPARTKAEIKSMSPTQIVQKISIGGAGQQSVRAVSPARTVENKSTPAQKVSKLAPLAMIPVVTAQSVKNSETKAKLHAKKFRSTIKQVIQKFNSHLLHDVMQREKSSFKNVAGDFKRQALQALVEGSEDVSISYAKKKEKELIEFVEKELGPLQDMYRGDKKSLDGAIEIAIKRMGFPNLNACFQFLTRLIGVYEKTRISSCNKLKILKDFFENRHKVLAEDKQLLSEIVRKHYDNYAVEKGQVRGVRIDTERKLTKALDDYEKEYEKYIDTVINASIADIKSAEEARKAKTELLAKVVGIAAGPVVGLIVKGGIGILGVLLEAAKKYVNSGTMKVGLDVSAQADGAVKAGLEFAESKGEEVGLGLIASKASDVLFDKTKSFKPGVDLKENNIESVECLVEWIKKLDQQFLNSIFSEEWIAPRVLRICKEMIDNQTSEKGVLTIGELQEKVLEEMKRETKKAIDVYDSILNETQSKIFAGAGKEAVIPSAKMLAQLNGLSYVYAKEFSQVEDLNTELSNYFSKGKKHASGKSLLDVVQSMEWVKENKEVAEKFGFVKNASDDSLTLQKKRLLFKICYVRIAEIFRKHCGTILPEFMSPDRVAHAILEIAKEGANNPMLKDLLLQWQEEKEEESKAVTSKEDHVMPVLQQTLKMTEKQVQKRKAMTKKTTEAKLEGEKNHEVVKDIKDSLKCYFPGLSVLTDVTQQKLVEEKGKAVAAAVREEKKSVEDMKLFGNQIRIRGHFLCKNETQNAMYEVFHAIPCFSRLLENPEVQHSLDRLINKATALEFGFGDIAAQEFIKKADVKDKDFLTLTALRSLFQRKVEQTHVMFQTIKECESVCPDLKKDFGKVMKLLLSMTKGRRKLFKEESALLEGVYGYSMLQDRFTSVQKSKLVLLREKVKHWLTENAAMNFHNPQEMSESEQLSYYHFAAAVSDKEYELLGTRLDDFFKRHQLASVVGSIKEFFNDVEPFRYKNVLEEIIKTRVPAPTPLDEMLGQVPKVEEQKGTKLEQMLHLTKGRP